MKLRPFEYFEPKTIKEAVDLLAQLGERAVLLSGGTNIIPNLKDRKMNPGSIINIKRIDQLERLYADKEGVHIGALVNLAEMSAIKFPRRRKVPVSMQEKIPLLLRKIISLMANPQIRNIATLVGNVAWASPAADSAPPLLALDAVLKVQNQAGAREIPLDQFFLGPGKTELKKGEMITEILIPEASRKKMGGSQKFMKRKANTLAVASAAVTFSNGKGKTITDVRIAVGAVAPTPLRIKQAESILEGQVVDSEMMDKVKRIITEAINPITDVRSTAQFRREITPILVERCINDAFA